ncbi:Os08g0347500 [Oryza sativa Japonica Group]|uniref:Os08g0347500 protein n=1 Tax=Oryza sativa subsp. japonica TaxID=39947 RepID=A0A0P0XF80_ORYSJ|nr:hypothetical protein EE612_043684 [Oryza sativa]BAT05047.1 Os08g0347500 [Oryza sativa Japonica Group]
MATHSTSAPAAPAFSAFPLAAAVRFPCASATSNTCAFSLAEHLTREGMFFDLQSIKREAEERSRRRMLLAAGAAMFLSWPNPAAYAAEAKKGFLPVTDKKDGYSFLYPFGWQEVVVQGQDKVYKDVIEPLESVSVNTIPTSKQDIRELGPPDQVAEALIRKVLAAPTQKTKLIEAKENDVDGRTYYTFEFTAQAPNFTRHALGAIAIANGKFYTLTTGANERRWEKIKDRLHTVVDSFKIEAREQVRSGDASATEYFELGAVMLRRKFYPAAIKYLQQAIQKWDRDEQDLAQVRYPQLLGTIS